MKHLLKRGPIPALPALLICMTMVGCTLPSQAQPPANTEADAASARAQAPFDMTGQWVSVVTEDWRWRMLTAAPGDTGSVPVNQAGREASENWRPARVPSCLAHGAAGNMRQPGRLQISWEDQDTLRIDFSAGDQTRLLNFNGERESAVEPSLQGYTSAQWFKQAQSRGLGFGGPSRSFEGGNLRATTTGLLPAYLQRNGVPYSDQASMKEYFKVLDGPTGERWLIVTTVVTDPVYLRQDYITSTHFRQEANGDAWSPEACE